jgi:hypothetical protein
LRLRLEPKPLPKELLLGIYMKAQVDLRCNSRLYISMIESVKPLRLSVVTALGNSATAAR